MPQLMTHPPHTAVEPIEETFHGVTISDPYRWLEDQESPRTRAWIKEQSAYARAYLDAIPGRERIRERIREFLAVETYDTLLHSASHRFFFRKRRPDHEQPSICMREGIGGEDQVLIDPAERGTGNYTAVRPLCISPEGRLLLYEVKEGGERTGTFELFDIAARKRLPDVLPRGYLRGFAFAPDGKSFYYVHEAMDTERPLYRAAYHHVIGTRFSQDPEVFFAGEDEQLRLSLSADKTRLAFFVYRFLDKTITNIYFKEFTAEGSPILTFSQINYMLGLNLLDNKIFAITDRNAPNRRIVEIRLQTNGEHEWIDIVPETDTPINDWCVAGKSIFVSYVKALTHRVLIFDFQGNKTGELPIQSDETLRIFGGSPDNDEVLLETESFTQPIAIFRYSPGSNERTLWAKRNVPFDSAQYNWCQVWYTSKDGTKIPMYLAGRHDTLSRGANATIMTSYGGYGVSMTPQFSVFVAFLMERGCLFALPNIRGGSEFGVEWHNAAKRRNRQTAYDDFLCAADWLVKTGRTAADRLAIFGGSNSGLLVGAALTQRPDLFRAVVCMVPMLDMLRYHLFDGAHVWKEELGTVDDPEDFAALAKYSPYHQVRDGVPYPAVMIVSGDADRNCNPLHARKMAARLQAANSSPYPIFIDYNKHRGHSPVLPLGERVEALTDRMAFLCDQLQLQV